MEVPGVVHEARGQRDDTRRPAFSFQRAIRVDVLSGIHVVSVSIDELPDIGDSVGQVLVDIEEGQSETVRHKTADRAFAGSAGAAIAEFERARLAERVRLGLARVRAQGRRLGRPKRGVTDEQLAFVSGLSARQGAKQLGVSPSTLYRRLIALKQ
jgi:hypothetical protein